MSRARMYPELEAYVLYFGLTMLRPWRYINQDMVCQLMRCRSDEARRLILGISSRQQQCWSKWQV